MVLINELTIDEINAALVHLQRSRTEIVGGAKGDTINNILINNTGGGNNVDYSNIIDIIQNRLNAHDKTIENDEKRLEENESLDSTQQEQIESLFAQLEELSNNGIQSLQFDATNRYLIIYTQDGNTYDVEIPSETVTMSFDSATNKLIFQMGNQTQEVVLPFINTSQMGVAGGVATLDENGRVPYSQLPESAMEFKGEWDASTNTPTLTDGTGTNGDFYICSAGGTVNFGTQAEPRLVTFVVNDRVIYEGDTDQWVKLPAGQVASVNGQSGVVELDAADIPYNSTLSVKDKLDSATQSDWTQTDSTQPDFIKHKIPIWITNGSADDNMTPVDSVTSGEMRPVTSNAVAQKGYLTSADITNQVTVDNMQSVSSNAVAQTLVNYRQNRRIENYRGGENSGYVRMFAMLSVGSAGNNHDCSVAGLIRRCTPTYIWDFYFNVQVRGNGATIQYKRFSIFALNGGTKPSYIATTKVSGNNFTLSFYVPVTSWTRDYMDIWYVTYGDVFNSASLFASAFQTPIAFVSAIPSDETQITMT